MNSATSSALTPATTSTFPPIAGDCSTSGGPRPCWPSWKPRDGTSPHVRKHRLYLLARALTEPGRRHNETISAWVSRFNRDGLAAVRPGHGGGPRTRYGADEQQRILAEWARTPQRDQDGTATWSLSLLQRALRQAPDGLPRVSTFTIWRTLHAGGLSWQKSRTWCETGVVMRKRKHVGAVRVSDPDALAKKS